MADDTQDDAEVFRSFAGEIVHLDNSEAWRVIGLWLVNQGDRYHRRFKDTAQLIWAERDKLRREHPQYWRRARTMKKRHASAAA
jgi:hypothetical protein